MSYRAYQIDCVANKMPTKEISDILNYILEDFERSEMEVSKNGESIIFQIGDKELDKERVRLFESKLNHCDITHWERQP